MTKDQLKTIFTFHPPTEEQRARYDAIRAAGLAHAEAILAHTPMSGERTLAIRKVQEATQMACAAIACNEPDANAYRATAQG